jgi:hypothetical protein
MDRTARLTRIRDLVDNELAFNRELTRRALVTEAHLRRDGDPERIARMVTPDADTSNVAD